MLIDGLEDVGIGRQLTDAVRYVLILGSCVGVDTCVTCQQQAIPPAYRFEDATSNSPSSGPAVDEAILLQLADVLSVKRFDRHEHGGVLEVAADGLEVLQGAVGADCILVITIACSAWNVSMRIIGSTMGISRGVDKRTPKAIELGAQSRLASSSIARVGRVGRAAGAARIEVAETPNVSRFKNDMTKMRPYEMLVLQLGPVINARLDDAA